jgi:hypothetical protein
VRKEQQKKETEMRKRIEKKLKKERRNGLAGK